MAEAHEGDKVKVHYTGKLSSGEVFDSSKEREEPIEFTIGDGNIIPGFEKAVDGMSPGDSKTVTLPPDEAYGERSEERMFEVAKDQLPDDLDVAEGQRLQVRHQSGESTVVRVAEVQDETVKLDANHPLAGEELTFDIELVDVESA